MSKRCMRCPYARPRNAENARQFSVGDRPTEVNHFWLCDEHAQQFDREFNQWARYADVVEVAESPVTRALRPGAPSEFGGDEAAARIRELKERARANEKAGQEHAADSGPGDALIGPRDDRWRLSPQAQKRIAECAFDERQVLRAATDPEKSLPKSTARDEWYQIAGDCYALVDRRAKRVITVYTQLEYFCAHARKEGA